MPQFDVYKNNSASIPFLLDVQHNLHADFRTRLVVPLVALSEAGKAAQLLCPIFEIQGKQVVMSTPEMAGYPAADLRTKITTLEQHRDTIIGAIDFLLVGF